MGASRSQWWISGCWLGVWWHVCLGCVYNVWMSYLMFNNTFQVCCFIRPIVNEDILSKCVWLCTRDHWTIIEVRHSYQVSRADHPTYSNPIKSHHRRLSQWENHNSSELLENMLSRWTLTTGDENRTDDARGARMSFNKNKNTDGLEKINKVKL